MAEAAFSEDGKYYSAITSDGRLKIWDTETSALKQEYTPNLHLAAPPTCLQWITVSQNAGKSPKPGKNRSSVSENASECIALGTSNGKVLIYSVAQAKVQAVLHRKNGNNKINALDWHRKFGLFSCCGKENIVEEWDLQAASVTFSYNITVDNKSKQGNVISTIKIIPHKLDTKASYIITASWQVRLWRFFGGEATPIKTLGHNASQTAVLAVATLNDQSWLIEGSQNERLLSFWDVTITDDHAPDPQVNGDPTPTKKKRKKSFTEKKSLSDVPVVSNAAYNFVLEDVAKTVDVGLKEEDGSIRLQLAAATRSGLVHYYSHTLNGQTIKPLKPSVTVQVSTPEASPLPLQCCRVQDPQLLLGYTQGPLLVFDTLIPDLKSKTQVLIRGEKQTKKSKQQVGNEVAKTRSDAQSADATVLEPMGGVSGRKRATPGGQIEVPMEARLANLSIAREVKTDGAVSQNRSKLLVQGLQSQDDSILKLVIHNAGRDVAQRTVANLPADCVPLLLQHLSELATLKTSTCYTVLTWLQAVLERHAALLLAMSATNADPLSRLGAVFTHRRSHLCQLLNLKGRVELTMNQRTASEDAQKEAVLQYRDETSSEEEEDMQIEKTYKSDSEESWGDEMFDADGEQNERSGDERSENGEKDEQGASSSDDSD